MFKIANPLHDREQDMDKFKALLKKLARAGEIDFPITDEFVSHEIEHYDREKQEKEVMEYLAREGKYLCSICDKEHDIQSPLETSIALGVIKAIMRRYDLVPRGE